VRCLFTAALLLLLAACGSQPQRQADIVIERAHSGGSWLAISADSKILASGGWSGYVRLWDLETGREIRSWRAHTDSVNGIFFLPDGSIQTAGYDGRIARWSRNGTELQSRQGTPVTASAIDLRNSRFVTGHKDGTLSLWSLHSGEAVRHFQPHRKQIRSVAVSPDGALIATSATDTRVALAEPASGDIRYLDRPDSDPRTLAFAPEGNALYGAGWFKLFRWNTDSGRIETLDTEHRGIINNIQFTPDGKLASISRQTDSAVLFLDPISGNTSSRFQQHDLCGVAVNVSPDGRFLATTSDDASVRIWRLRHDR
jgi:WD40 repeat protein